MRVFEITMKSFYLKQTTHDIIQMFFLSILYPQSKFAQVKSLLNHSKNDRLFSVVKLFSNSNIVDKFHDIKSDLLWDSVKVIVLI